MSDQHAVQPIIALDERELMTICVCGLLRYAQELESVQGRDALERIIDLRDLTGEIASFWDLDGTLLVEPIAAEQ